MKKIKIEKKYIEGAVSFEERADGIKPWRLPYNELVLFPAGPENILADRAERLAGVRLRFSTDSSQITLVVSEFITYEPEPCLFDLSIDNQYQQTVELALGKTHVRFDKLPEGEKIIDIWLPQSKSLTLRYLLIDDNAHFAVPKEQRLQWITYGSSITHCRNAESPAKTWPAIVARKYDLNLTCLGYGGQCHLDSMIARIIRDLPADMISLKLGVNIHGASSLSPRTFKSAIIGFVKIIREKHIKTPIAVISPIYSTDRDTKINEVGLSLQQMRIEVKDAVDRLIASGDSEIQYFSGLDLFDSKLANNYMPDGLHPSSDGYEFLAENMSSVIMKNIIKKLK